ncbi:hypothetical protein SAMN05444412_11696 [Rhodonellum ikkaensis]|uniref:Uncharacterized protein n=1 Tax=Rhodonellum ikkaensis TaxID=336829 RepID=A0A1H3TCQ1_9BACT|nr:hypothetical protein SAMN05444412_11696 [Rhodonellum ikkaensis]
MLRVVSDIGATAGSLECAVMVVEGFDILPQITGFGHLPLYRYSSENYGYTML